MLMPSAGSYSTAVQNPAHCFTDSELQQAVSRKNKMGQPVCMSGQCAVVFPMISPAGQKYAVKCFTHHAPNQLRRYTLIHQGLTAIRPGWATDFVFHSEGVKVDGKSYPLLRMNWIEGSTLTTWLDAHGGNPRSIARLATRFDQLVDALARVGIAHGDLQHGNILVLANGQLRLVDYDGIYLPGVGLEEFPPDETGHPDYQSPGRSIAYYGGTMDHFSAWLISLSLKVLAADPTLMDQLNPGRGEYLLLDRNDFAKPESSKRLGILERHPNGQVRRLAKHMRGLLEMPLRAIPPLVASMSSSDVGPRQSSTSSSDKWWQRRFDAQRPPNFGGSPLQGALGATPPRRARYVPPRHVPPPPSRKPVVSISTSVCDFTVRVDTADTRPTKDVEFTFDWGDGKPATTTPTYVYDRADRYTIWVTGTNSDGSSTATTVVTLDTK